MPDRALRDDVRLLGSLLGETLRTQEGDELFEMVERVRALSKSGREGDIDDFETLLSFLAKRPTEEALPVARAFAHFLNLANVAEQHHRVRRRREYLRETEAQPQPGSCDEVFGRLIAGGVAPDRLFEAVATLRVELVLTAHPTEVVRRTLLQKYGRIAEQLALRDHEDMTEVERRDSLDQLRREIMSAWETDEVRHERPSPLDEVKGGLFVFEQTLWNALPQYLRLLDAALRKHCGVALPLDATPIRFGSWIGGDRDGNPNVTPEVTADACLLARWVAVDLYLREIDALRSELSMSRASPELEDVLSKLRHATEARPNTDLGPRLAREPYRALLKVLRMRLAATRDSLDTAMTTPGGWRNWPPPGDGTVISSAAELLDPLLLCHRSLVETGNAPLAEGRLLDLIRRAAVFGMTLVRLDIRQDSSRHDALFDALSRELGLGSYSELNEEEKQQFLARELLSRRPLFPPDISLDDRDRDTLETFHAIASIHPESLGAYVITMAGAPSDVLEVVLLQKEAGIERPLRVVPLFETVADLRAAPETMRRLFAIEEYATSIDGRQEVMIGYSDSSKDAGRFAAGWELYKAQERIVEAARDHSIALTLFHGRGGSVGRGGGPTYVAIQSQPPGSVEGRLRVTVQGEMIQAEFGLVGIALRTLEIYTTAALDATLDEAKAPRPEWRELMERMADSSTRAYRALVYESPDFLKYFRTATPEVELSELNIGSRPARRPGGKSGVESLRAIPWQFAWTQSRLLLPSWLGFAEAIQAAIDSGDEEMLREMYREWPFLRSMIELVEMVLAKAEPLIAAQYDRLLVPEELRPIGSELRAQLIRTSDVVLRLTGEKILLASNPVLRRSIEVRNPYVDPINIVQAEILRRYRADRDPKLRDAFVVTVNGIAAGMRNTG